MNRKELEERLEKEGVRSDAYSLYGANYEECLILSQLPYGKWEVYYRQKGMKSGLKQYSNENDACEEFLKILLRDSLTRK